MAKITKLPALNIISGFRLLCVQGDSVRSQVASLTGTQADARCPGGLACLRLGGLKLELTLRRSPGRL